MGKSVAYIGESIHHQAYLAEMNLRFGAVVRNFRLADEAIATLEREKFDLILIKDEVAPGNLELPFSIPRFFSDDGLFYFRVSAYTVKKIREKGANVPTPIVLPHLGGITPVRQYLDAGVTIAHDIFRDKNMAGLIDKLRPYLV